MSQNQPTYLSAILSDSNESLMRPLADVVFSKIFENAAQAGTAMRSFINAVRSDAKLPPIASITDMRSQATQLGNIGNRGCRMDVQAIDQNGHIINVEVQLSDVNHMLNRSLFNFAQMYQNEVKPNTDYKDLPSVSLVSILDGDIRPDNPSYHQQYALSSLTPPMEFQPSNLHMHMLELPKFQTRLKERFGADLSKSAQLLRHLEKEPLALWLYALSEGYQHKDFMKEASHMDEGMREFAERYNIVASDKDLRHTYHNWRVGQMDISQGKYDAEMRGRAEGEKRGRAEGADNLLRSLIASGIPSVTLRTAATQNGISEQRLNQLVAEVKAGSKSQTQDKPAARRKKDTQER